MTDRQGVEIDYCQRCRGVWLDRGELDKIIELSMGEHQQYSSEPRYEERESHENRGHYEDRSHHKQHDDYKYGYKKKKKESFLGELFDF
jgi:Zn-finger nucleic acid-binding protein